MSFQESTKSQQARHDYLNKKIKEMEENNKELTELMEQNNKRINDCRQQLIQLTKEMGPK